MAVPTLLQQTKILQVNPGANGISAVFPNGTTVGSAVFAVVAGLKDPNPYTALTLNAATTAPAVKVAGSSMSLVEQQINPLKDQISGYHPSIFVFQILNVAAGRKSVDVTGLLDANQNPIFNGGIGVWAYEFSGVATAAALDDHGSRLTAAGAAKAKASMTTAQSGEVALLAALLIEGDNFVLPAGFTILHQDQLLSAIINLVTAYSVGRAPAVATITNVAVTTNVATVTAPNTFAVGDSVTVAATTHTAINGTFTVLSATASLFTYAVVTGNIVSAADTGSATFVIPDPTASLNNQSSYNAVVAQGNFKHS